MSSETDTSLASQCLGFCQMLASQDKDFSFCLKIGSTFAFTLDTKVKVQAPEVARKQKTPSSMRRNARRRQEFLNSKETSTKNRTTEVEEEALESPATDSAKQRLVSCDQCGHTTKTRGGITLHKKKNVLAAMLNTIKEDLKEV